MPSLRHDRRAPDGANRPPGVLWLTGVMLCAASEMFPVRGWVGPCGMSRLADLCGGLAESPPVVRLRSVSSDPRGRVCRGYPGEFEAPSPASRDPVSKTPASGSTVTEPVRSKARTDRASVCARTGSREHPSTRRERTDASCLRSKRPSAPARPNARTRRSFSHSGIAGQIRYREPTRPWPQPLPPTPAPAPAPAPAEQFRRVWHHRMLRRRGPWLIRRRHGPWPF